MFVIPSPHPSRVQDPEAPVPRPAAQGGEPVAGEDDCLAGLEEGIQPELHKDRGQEDSPLETPGEGDGSVGDGGKGAPEREGGVADTSEEELPVKKRRRRMGMCGLRERARSRGVEEERRREGREVEESAGEDGESSTEIGRAHV